MGTWVHEFQISTAKWRDPLHRVLEFGRISTRSDYTLEGFLLRIFPGRINLNSAHFDLEADTTQFNSD